MKRDREMEKDRQKLQYTVEREGGRQAVRKGIWAERHFGWGKWGETGRFNWQSPFVVSYYCKSIDQDLKCCWPGGTRRTTELAASAALANC